MSRKLPRVTASRVLRALRKAGWYVHHQHGSHLTLKNESRPGARVTLAMHQGEDVLPKTLLSILEQAEMSREEFLELL
ncbi:MAG: type II toxin-antitoxin system HicA family toxin [Dehalococcoidia bacterium]|nr:type II toxin-antitoxin system HicA family toxin [Dehalococcoidia bacterium]